MNLSPRSKEAVSGVTAGVLSTVVNHPLDVIKVRLQLDFNSKNQLQSFKNIVSSLFIKNASSSVWQNSRESMRNLYRGLSINIFGNTVSWGLYFMLYNDLKNISFVHVFSSKDHESSRNSYYNYMASSFMAGSITTLLTNPIWVLKTRLLSTNKNFPNAYKSIWDGVTKIIKDEGPRTFFKGFTPALVSVCQGSMYFTIYDSLKHYHTKNFNNRSTRDGAVVKHKFSFYEYLYITSVSKIVSTAVFYPFQLFKSRLQSYNFQLDTITKSDSGVAKGNQVAQTASEKRVPPKQTSTQLKLRTIIKETYVNEGIKGFYKGLYINIIRTLPATCITFLTYESMKNFLY